MKTRPRLSEVSMRDVCVSVWLGTRCHGNTCVVYSTREEEEEGALCTVQHFACQCMFWWEKTTLYTRHTPSLSPLLVQWDIILFSIPLCVCAACVPTVIITVTTKPSLLKWNCYYCYCCYCCVLLLLWVWVISARLTPCVIFLAVWVREWYIRYVGNL